MNDYRTCGCARNAVRFIQKADRMRNVAFLIGVFMMGIISDGYGQQTRPSGEHDLRHADIRFVLPDDRGANTIFRKRLIDWGTTKQIRNSPVALGGGVTDSPTYVIAIFGSCDDAIRDVLPAIEYAASNLPLEATIVSSYRSTAKCTEKEGRE